MTEPRKYAAKTRGRPFQKGNAGRPKGSRHKASLLAEKLMSDDVKAIVEAVLKAARDGDMTAARLVLDRIAPTRRDNSVSFALPKIQSPTDAAKAFGAILAAVAAGDITPGEATEVARLIVGYITALEASEFEQRLRALETNKPQ